MKAMDEVIVTPSVVCQQLSRRLNLGALTVCQMPLEFETRRSHSGCTCDWMQLLRIDATEAFSSEGAGDA